MLQPQNDNLYVDTLASTRSCRFIQSLDKIFICSLIYTPNDPFVKLLIEDSTKQGYVTRNSAGQCSSYRLLKL